MQGYIGALHEYANASMPLATAVPAGTVVYNTTYSVEMRSNGTRWVPLGPVRIYANSGDIVVTNTTTETEIATFTVPAGMMGTGHLLIYAAWGMTSSANVKQFKVLFGGSPLIFISGFASTASVSGLFPIRNTTETTQVGSNAVAVGIGTTGGALASATVDTTVDVTVSVYLKMAALAETITMKNLYVEIHQ